MKKSLLIFAFLAQTVAWLTPMATFAGPAESKPTVLIPITIASEPSGATVTLDKTALGSTPLTTSVSAGRHLATISLANYETAYKTLKVEGATVTESIKLTPITSTVLIQSEPAGATVTRDGATAGETPLLIPEVPIGKYRIGISLTGYKPQEVDLTVAGSAPQRIKAQLVSSSATLDVTSDPSGAGVSVNGIYRGETPIKIDKIQEGSSFLEVTAAGFSPYKEQLQLAAGEVFAVHVPLKAIPSKLSIVSIPAGARAYVNNEFKGETPIELNDLPAGSYRLRVEKDKYDPLARTVEIGNNKTVTEEFRLTANIGSIRVSTSPADVSIFISGKEAGKTVAKQEATDQISEPLIIQEVLTGEHEVSFVRQGYTPVKKTITVKRNETAVLESVKLPRLFIPDIELQTRNGVYKGVYIGKDQELYRIETSPGLIRAFPNADIVKVRIIRAENTVEDNTVKDP